MAKEKVNEAHHAHLIGLNQPSTIYEEDENSLHSGELFDAPKTHVSLLTAAKLAKSKSDKQKLSTPDREESKSTAFEPIDEISISSLSQHSIKVDAFITISNSSVEKVEDSSLNDHVDAYTMIDELSHESSLSSRELDELDFLFSAFKKGESVNKSRLYELDLFDKWQCGEVLTAKEKSDLLAFRKQRGKDRAYRREFQLLLDQKEKGIAIDESRLYVLGLMARRQLGEELSAEEMDYLEAAEDV